MKIFIFDYLKRVSGAYHPGGGLVVIAKDKDHLFEIIKDNSYIRINDDEWKDVAILDLLDDKVEPTYWVMPDAGRC